MTLHMDARLGITRFAYDGLNRRVAETNEAGVVTRFGYDGLGRLNAVTNAHGTTDATWATYAYDETGNQTNQVDALGRVTRYEYDRLGRRTRRILPGSQSESFVYNPVGHLLAHTNFINTVVITNEYDLMNRLLRKWAGPVQFENYGYSATGQRTGRTDASGNYTWVYDLRDRVRTNTTPVAALYYEYDRHGNLTNLLSSTVNGVSLAYEYDALNRVTNVIDNRLTGTKNTAYSFDQVGNLKTIKYPTALTNLWEYDARNRLTNGVWKQNATTRGSFYYELAVAGNRTNLSEAVNGVNRTYSWSYDQLYRLTNELISGSGAVSYGYDRASNRTNRQSTISQLTTTNYTHNTNDWLTTDIYDENGNTRTNGSNTYAYDWANRLTNSGLISIVYNADGYCIKKTTATTTTLYLVDALNLTGYPQVLEELTLSGSVTNLFRWYIYGLDLIGWHEGVLLRYCGYDGHGSVRFAVNGSGTVGVTYAYDAYGTVIATTGSSSSPYRYAGEQWDADLGLYFLRARYMKTDTGRFWTMDSFEGDKDVPLSLHKYIYADDNPVNKVDPSGTMTIQFALDMSEAIGMRAHWEATRTPAYVGVTARTKALVQIAGFITAGYLGDELIIAKTNVRDLLNKARNIWRNKNGNAKMPKIVPMPAEVIPAVAAHVAKAQATGRPARLQRAPIGLNILHRARVLIRSGPAPSGLSWDEYPFASSMQGGNLLTISMAPVPRHENSIQGGIIMGSYIVENIQPGDWFEVVVIP